MAAGSHFGCPKITLYRISYHFRSIPQILFKMAAGGHFGCPKIPFGHFWSFQIDMQLFFFSKFLTKWLTSAILDVRISLSIAFLAISDRYATLFVLEIFDKMADGGHFGSIQNFVFPTAILDVRKSLWIAFLAISDRSAILDVRNSLSMAFLAISDPNGTLFYFFIFDILDVRKSLSIAFLAISHRGCMQLNGNPIQTHVKLTLLKWL